MYSLIFISLRYCNEFLHEMLLAIFVHQTLLFRPEIQKPLFAPCRLAFGAEIKSLKFCTFASLSVQKLKTFYFAPSLRSGAEINNRLWSIIDFAQRVLFLL
jgi:hypothetical protein